MLEGIKGFKYGVWQDFAKWSLRTQGYKVEAVSSIDGQHRVLNLMGAENVQLQFGYGYDWRGIKLFNELARDRPKKQRLRLPALSFNILMANAVDERRREVAIIPAEGPLWNGLLTFVEVVTTNGKVKQITRIYFCHSGTHGESTRSWSEVSFVLRQHAKRFSRQRVTTIREDGCMGICLRYGRKASPQRAERLIGRVIATMQEYGFTELRHEVRATA